MVFVPRIRGPTCHTHFPHIFIIIAISILIPPGMPRRHRYIKNPEPDYTFSTNRQRYFGEWNGTVGFIGVEDITTGTIDMSLINPIQDDITNSVCPFVPCAAGLCCRTRPKNSPGRNRLVRAGIFKIKNLKKNPSLRPSLQIECT